MDEIYQCEHCGKVCEDELDLDVMHRGCRLKAAFPEAIDKEKSVGGLLVFDMSKIKTKLEGNNES